MINRDRFSGRKRFAKVDIFAKYLKHFFYFCAQIKLLESMKQDMIVILDLGSHENTVVARAIRALGVYSEI